METLQLKHLAPYLFNELKIEWNDTGEIFEIHFESETDWENRKYPFSTILFCLNRKPQDLGFKLILRPLSDLTKEDYSNKLAEFIYNEEPESFDDIEGVKKWFRAILNLEGSEFLNLPYKIVSKLIEWHFDVFGLIPEGLAIDINTLK